mgnify:CR=1 FL=1
MKSGKCYAYIDGANLHKGTAGLGWRVDYSRLQTWLKDKYQINRAYVFMGFIAKYEELYRKIRAAGFTLIFKEIVYDKAGKPKGNCDTDLAIRAVADIYENKVNSIVLVTSDGDYACLVTFLKEHLIHSTIISPSREEECSILLKRTDAPIVYISEQRSKLELHTF